MAKVRHLRSASSAASALVCHRSIQLESEQYYGKKKENTCVRLNLQFSKHAHDLFAKALKISQPLFLKVMATKNHRSGNEKESLKG